MNESPYIEHLMEYNFVERRDIKWDKMASSGAPLCDAGMLSYGPGSHRATSGFERTVGHKRPTR